MSCVAACIVACAACGACKSDAPAGSPSGSSGGASGASGSSGGSSGGSGGSSGAVDGAPGGPATRHAGCRVFPADNPWNRDVSADPVDAALTSALAASLSPTRGLHPDWGTTAENYGIPITAGPAAAPAPISWNTSYGPRESDKLPCPSGGGEFCYPIPTNAGIEGGRGASPGSDRHVLFLDTNGAPDRCTLYELYNAQNPTGAGWTAGSGAIWRLDTNALRTEGWTSADAAGLPVMAGLVRWEEIARGEIPHALRFTMARTRHAYILPATHAAGSQDASLPPMGLRVRLRAGFDDSAFTGPAKIITTAMKRYGMLLADNGSDWYVTGETHDMWASHMDDLNAMLGKVKGSDFEIVRTGAVTPMN